MRVGSDFHQVDLFYMAPLKGKLTIQGFNCAETDICKLDRTRVPNMHITMRRRLLGQMMAVTLIQLVASTSSIFIWVWGFPSIIEISGRKFKLRLISEVLVNSV
jgi:hypothetical protein